MLSKICCGAALCALLLLPADASARRVNVLKPIPVSSISGPIVPNIPVILPPAVVEVSLTSMASTPNAPAMPSVLEPLKRLSCVPYARLRSGLQIFGDAKTWWAKAKSLYAQVAAPVSEAVMVFSGSKRIGRGHVAVVTEVVNSREIKVDHANWQNRGEIDLNMPVLDVSQNNDWSEVRVWNMRTNNFGDHVYKISGFITHDPVTVAAR